MVIIILLLICTIATLLGFPGNTIIFLTALCFAVYDNFVHINSNLMAIIFFIYLAGETGEYIAGYITVKRKKASKKAVIYAIIGGIAGGLAGTLFLPVIGSFVGYLLGTYIGGYIGEYKNTNNRTLAKAAAINITATQLASVLFKVIVSIVMITTIVINLP